MFSALRVLKNPFSASSTRAFSTSQPFASDVAKLTLVGRLSQDAESRLTKNEKPYVKYSVVTNSASSQGGERQYVPNFHQIFCFNPYNLEYLSKLKKGTRVFVQANYSIMEPDPSADSTTYQGQRHVSLIHDNITVLNPPKLPQTEESEFPEPAGSST